MIGVTGVSKWFSALRRTARLSALIPVILAFAVAAIPAAQAQTFSLVYSFTGGTDGQTPLSLVPDSAGNLYGVASAGGQYFLEPTASRTQEFSFGTLFEVNQKGAETVLHTFTLDGSADGWVPQSIMQGKDGSFYGIAGFGGDLGCGVSNGCGVVFKYSQGTYSVFSTPTDASTEGSLSCGNPLVQDSAGNLYGTSCDELFKIDTKGKETVLHTFTGVGGDGSFAAGNLLLDASGNLYGTTTYGGANDFGIVYKFNLKKSTLTTLYSFTNGKDGANPRSLVMDSAGNLYGGAFGYTYGNLQPGGRIYKITPAGVFSVVYTFTGGADGASPRGPLVLDSSGNLYGVSSAGGLNVNGINTGWGVVFKVNLSTGKETVLHSFLGLTDGAYPQGIAMDKEGTLYGVTYSGGFL